MARRCLFCDEKATTKEHALPEWISNRFGLRTTFLDLWAAGGDVPTNRIKQPISAKSMRRRMLCKDCQTYYKHLEDRTIPILEPMGKGERVTLDRSAQAILAEWGAKTAATIFGYIDRENYIPDEHRKTLRQTGKPLPDVFVAYLRFTGAESVFISTPSIPRIDHPDAPRLSYNAVAAFGQVAFKVFGVLEPAPHDTFRLPKDRGVQVWPEWSIPFDWPPPVPIVDAEVTELVGFIPVAPGPDGPTYVSTYPGINE